MPCQFLMFLNLLTVVGTVVALSRPRLECGTLPAGSRPRRQRPDQCSKPQPARSQRTEQCRLFCEFSFLDRYEARGLDGAGETTAPT